MCIIKARFKVKNILGGTKNITFLKTMVNMTAYWI
jgi:hypothetical protein